MTLNLMLTTRSKVYLTGDFRLTYKNGRETSWKDDLNCQKLIPVVKQRWNALVAFTGIAKTSHGLDVGDWLSERLGQLPLRSRHEELWEVLLSSNDWITKINGYHALTLSAVGFIERRPFAGLVSNIQDIAGNHFSRELPLLKKTEIRPNKEIIRVLGDTPSVKQSDIDFIYARIRAKDDHGKLHSYLAELNLRASGRSTTISPECVTGHLSAAGSGEITPHGIRDNFEYMPNFVRRPFIAQGFTGFICKKDISGRPLPPRWVGMTITKSQEKTPPSTIAMLHVVRNVESHILKGQDINNKELFWSLV